MAENTPSSDEVIEATGEDLANILAWLKREYDEDSGSGFLVQPQSHKRCLR